MADGLDDEWWLDTKEQGHRSEDEDDQIKTSNRKKDFGILDGELSEEPKKKKRKRLKITDKLAKREDSPATSKDFNSWLDKCGSGKLCAVELEDLHLKESFLLCNPNLSHLSEYLNNVIRDWTSLKSESKEKNTCSVLLVTSSAKRAVDLNRDAQKFKGKCSSAKLFAKHMKLKDQISFLGKKKIDFAIGTPNRIGAIIGAGALNISKTRYLILDWNWRDVKKRRMIDLPELEKDLFALLKDHFLPLLENSKMKIGLY